MDRTDGLPLARSTGRFWQVEYRFQAVPQMGQSGCFLSCVQEVSQRRRLRIRYARRQHCQSPPSRIGRKRGGSKSGHRALPRRHNQQDHGLDRHDRQPIDFRLLLGQAHDLRGTAFLIEGLTCGQLLADRAFDANWLRDALAKAGIVPVVPRKSNRRFPSEFDGYTHKWHHLIETFFQKLKKFRGYRHALLQNR